MAGDVTGQPAGNPLNPLAGTVPAEGVNPGTYTLSKNVCQVTTSSSSNTWLGGIVNTLTLGTLDDITTTVQWAGYVICLLTDEMLYIYLGWAVLGALLLFLGVDHWLNLGSKIAKGVKTASDTAAAAAVVAA